MKRTRRSTRRPYVVRSLLLAASLANLRFSAASLAFFFLSASLSALAAAAAFSFSAFSYSAFLRAFSSSIYAASSANLSFSFNSFIFCCRSLRSVGDCCDLFSSATLEAYERIFSRKLDGVERHLLMVG